jgi:hypothetical protein
MSRTAWRLLVAACLVLPLAACAPGEDTAPPASPPPGNEVDGVSLTLGASHLTYGRPGREEKATLFLTVWNASPRPRRLAGFRVPQGNARYRNNDLRWPRDLSWVLRFPDGDSVMVRHSCRLVFPLVGGRDGVDLLFGPLELPAGGSLREEFSLRECVFGDSPDAREARQRCGSFCVTAVVDGLGLRSNTLFFNGRFALPAGYDPIAEGLGYRQGRGAKQESEYQQDMAERDREAARANRGRP